MSNSKALREAILKQAGSVKLPIGKYAFGEITGPVCFTCRLCWRRSLQSDLNNLQCPFCGGNIGEVANDNA